MPYVALRSMKVQKPDRTVEVRSPGDPVPEAESWPNVELWVRRGYISPADGATLQPVKAVKKPMVPITPDGKPIEDLAKYKAERDGFAEPPASAPAGSVAPTHESLSKLTKVQLVEMGERYGVLLSDAALKEELIASVLAAAAGA